MKNIWPRTNGKTESKPGKEKGPNSAATVEPNSIVVRNIESHFHESSSRVFGTILVSRFLLPSER